MNKLYNFPKSAAFGRMLAKSKIYEYAMPTSKVRDLFVCEVEKITWSYKLSPATINLPASDGVQEIQVFTVNLRSSELSYDVLRTIDKAIPSPILFELQHKGKTQYTASYKRPSGADRRKWVISGYFQSEWIADNAIRTDLPIVLNMSALYQSFLMALSPLNLRKGENLDELVLRVEALRVKEQNVKKIESQIKKEKQFNRRVELNHTLSEMKAEIESLKI